MLDNVNLSNSSDMTAQERSPVATAHNEMLATYARFYWGLAFQDRHAGAKESEAALQAGDGLCGNEREPD